jgi:hypothetical protein
MKRSTFLKICLSASALTVLGANMNQYTQLPKDGKFTKVLTVHFPEGKDFSSFSEDRNQWINSQATHEYTSKCIKDKTITDFKKVVGLNKVEFHYSFRSLETANKFLDQLAISGKCDRNIREKLGYRVSMTLLERLAA